MEQLSQNISQPLAQDWFTIGPIENKIAELPLAIAKGLSLTQAQQSFEIGRNIGIVPPHQLPPKPGLSTTIGQARLLHDLASIEMQAMELALRTLYEFPEAPKEFRQELAAVAEGEGRHLQLCLRALQDLGFDWGHWNAHLSLWNAVGPEDTLLDRILIVHRHLEGSGLDAGESIQRRLKGVRAPRTCEVLDLIVREEVDHVHFGSKWYRNIAVLEKIDPEQDFVSRISSIAKLAPKRDRVARELRLKAGFTSREIDAVEAEVALEIARNS